ncbi:GNAT family N-acetyltransferase [soil metagenome]
MFAGIRAGIGPVAASAYAGAMSSATAETRVIAAAEAPWADVRRVFGERGDPAHCFCQYFKVSAAAWVGQDRPAFERALCTQHAAAGPGPGVLAYLDSEPVGWCAVEPRANTPRIIRSRVGSASSEAESPGLWAVTCFVVRVGYRRKGLAAALLDGAIAHARRNGARVLEGYPVDTGGERASSAELYHGALSTFDAAGFELIARPIPGRALVRLRLERPES